jgi:hypothetical protein
VSSATISAWRPTRAFVACAAVAAWSVVWFSIGLARPTPALIGWLASAVAVPIAVRASWRAGQAGRTLWRYVAVGVLLDGLAGASNAHDYLSDGRRGQHISGFTAAIYVTALLTILTGVLLIRGGRRLRVEWSGSAWTSPPASSPW